MGVVIELGTIEHAAVKGHGVDFTFVTAKRKYTSDSIVGGVRLDYRMKRRVKMTKAGCSGEHSFEQGKRFLAGVCPIPRHVLARKASKRDHHIQEVDDKSVVKICETQEGLHVLDATRHWPVLDYLNL